MAHALHNMLEDVCGKKGDMCSEMTPVPSGIDLLKYIRNVSFTSESLKDDANFCSSLYV
jgi:hypothetical protein